MVVNCACAPELSEEAPARALECIASNGPMLGCLLSIIEVLRYLTHVNPDLLSGVVVAEATL